MSAWGQAWGAAWGDSWGASEEAVEQAIAPTPGIDWRFNMPQRPFIEQEEDTAPQVVHEGVAEATAPLTASPVRSSAPAAAVRAIENVERAAREAYLQEHARLMASESVRRAKRKRDAETLLLLM